MNRELLTTKQIDELVAVSEGWKTNQKSLTKIYTFADFKEAVSFVNRMAEIAESIDHHPDILISYRTVQLTLTTHSSGGITAMDSEFIKRAEKVSF